MKKEFRNQTVLIRAKKDMEHPYIMLSSSLLKLDGYERAIMMEILSNSDDFIINKNVVEKRLGFPHKKFLDSWKSLEDKHYILCDRFFGGVKWVINENPYANYDTRINYTGVINTQSEAGCISDTSIINTSIINTGVHLTNNKKTNNNRTNPESLSPKGESQDFSRTDTIQLADANCSISVPTVPVDDLYSRTSFEYNISSDLELELPELDFDIPHPFENFDNEKNQVDA